MKCSSPMKPYDAIPPNFMRTTESKQIPQSNHRNDSDQKEQRENQTADPSLSRPEQPGERTGEPCPPPRRPGKEDRQRGRRGRASQPDWTPSRPPSSAEDPSQSLSFSMVSFPWSLACPPPRCRSWLSYWRPAIPQGVVVFAGFTSRLVVRIGGPEYGVVDFSGDFGFGRRTVRTCDLSFCLSRFRSSGQTILGGRE